MAPVGPPRWWRWIGLDRAVVSDRLVLAGWSLAAFGILWLSLARDPVRQFGIRICLTVLICLLVAALYRIPRAKDVASAARPFWYVLATGLAIHAATLVVDLMMGIYALAEHTAQRFDPEQFAAPAAVVVWTVGLFRFPTLATTRGERAKMALDVSIVMLSAAVFGWYYGVGASWNPDKGWLFLVSRMAPAVSALVGGFALLRVAHSGAGVIRRPTLLWFGLAAAVPGLGDSVRWLALHAGSHLGLVSMALATVGATVQYAGDAEPPRRAVSSHRMRLFAYATYAASALVFALLVVSLAPTLGWRQWGVLIGVMAVSAAVTARQVVALYENNRLLGQNRALTERLEYLAWHDTLTGLANRARFGERLELALQHSRSRQSSLAVVLVDLDGFKVINDTQGHAAGDKVLIEVARRLRGTVRAQDTVCRLGGDEFALLLEDIDADRGAELADAIVAALAIPSAADDHSSLLSGSVGVAFAYAGQPGAEELLRDADLAMYAAKADGKNNWRIHQPPALLPLPTRSEFHGDSLASGEFPPLAGWRG